MEGRWEKRQTTSQQSSIGASKKTNTLGPPLHADTKSDMAVLIDPAETKLKADDAAFTDGAACSDCVSVDEDAFTDDAACSDCVAADDTAFTDDAACSDCVAADEDAFTDVVLWVCACVNWSFLDEWL